MGLFSSSKSSSTQNNYQTNYNVQGNEGVSLVGSSRNTVNITDGGAFDVVLSTNRAAFDVVSEALDTQLSANRAALDFGTKALGAIGDAENKALVFAERAATNALKFANDAGRPDTALAGEQMKYLAVAVAVGLLAWGMRGRK